MEAKIVVAIDRAFPNYQRLETELKELGGELVFAEQKDEDSLCELCAQADAVMVTFTKVTEKMIRAMEHCRVIIRTGIGVDNIDVGAAKKQQVPVSFVPDYCREEVADHTVALLLASARKLSLAQKTSKDHWDVKKDLGYVPRLSKCTAGILSFGAIGKMIASRLQAFGINVWAYDPYLPENVFTELGVKRCENADEIYSGADFIILTGPLTPERYHIINADSIKKMKKTAIIVNTARGPLVDEKALAAALREHRIAGAGLDVFEQEPLQNKELYDIDNLLITPHVAFFSEASLPDLQNKVFDEVLRAVKGETLRNDVTR